MGLLGVCFWADFKPDENQRIDMDFMTDMCPVTLGEPPETWTVDVERVVQVNDNNGQTRPVRRIVLVASICRRD